MHLENVNLSTLCSMCKQTDSTFKEFANCCFCNLPVCDECVGPCDDYIYSVLPDGSAKDDSYHAWWDDNRYSTYPCIECWDEL